MNIADEAARAREVIGQTTASVREAEIIANASAPPVMRQVLPEQPAILDEGFTTMMLGSDAVADYIWTQTMSLRFVSKPHGPQAMRILQQKWVNQDGLSIWVDVPMVTE